MCGIVGQVPPKLRADELAALLARQLSHLRHRGPDDSGTLITERFAFGHTRLAIIDLERGNQPMSSEDGYLHLIFNGEIYNFIELRADLQQKGHRFLTESDTEVLLAGYRQWGSDVVHKLRGMFAFALYDRSEDLLFCARDPFGQKPFFYTHFDGSLHFASELKAFCEIPGFSPQLDVQSLVSFLSSEAMYFDRTLYRGVRKLPPGHTLTVRQGEISLHRYFTSIPAESTDSFATCLEELEELFIESVGMAYRSDVPVAVLLSGGLDSSIVLAGLRRALPNEHIRSYHVTVDDLTYDEADYARRAAECCGAEHFVFNLSQDELARIATTVPALLDEPQADPGLLPKYFICGEIAKFSKVALTGDGGDELFYGYHVFKAQKLARYYRHLPNFIHRKVAPAMASLVPPRSGYMRFDFMLKHFLQGFPSDEATRNAKWTRSFSEGDLREILHPDIRPHANLRDTESYLYGIDAESKASAYLGKLAYLYQRTFLPDFVLSNSDRASMLQSVELRSPMLDPNLAACANAMADEHKMKGLQTKYILKKMAERYLPRDLIYRRKIGFTVPMASLIREHLADELRDLFSDSFLKKQRLFDAPPIATIIREHMEGKANHYKKIWTLYSLQKWLINNSLN